MDMWSLSATTVAMMREEQTVVRAMARRPSVPNHDLLIAIRRDLGELVGEAVRRIPDWEWEAWAKWEGFQPPVTPPS